ncbi:MAG: RagB/SusD family nutrient uptake outer membrane protein [Paludibacter sp.]|jgi:hypothetical protein|nr:RagB/SusD family nutrient uptake outer membrane protein [Paludibacter sp.]
MKKIIKIFVIALLSTTFVACEDFLNYTPSNAVSDTDAFRSAQDVENALNGVYYTLGRYQFYGRNVVALGDIAADNTYMLGTTGHFDTEYKYTIVTSNPELLEIWEYGYKTIDRAARVIEGGKALLETEISDDDQKLIKSCIAQSYAIKALSHFTLVNIFGLPYSDTNKSTLGIILVDEKPIAAFEAVSRATVAETYALVLKDINLAKTDINLAAKEVFTFNAASLSALEARVKLYMKDYNGASSAAQAAIAASGELVSDSTTYVDMWSSIASTSEDILTIGKTADDNLSANSLNTLYSNYAGKATSGLISLFAPTDMRLGLFGDGSGEQVRALKYKGLPTSAATSNIPVFRLPEMYLILAEAKAQLSESDAVDYLYEIAKRNSELAKTDIPTDKDELLQFISVERRRELFQEGHRWFDLRRTGEKLTRVGGNWAITNWDVSKFVYPIPQNEINASGISQNDGWNNNLPN